MIENRENAKHIIHLDKILAMAFIVILMASVGSAYGQYLAGTSPGPDPITECVRMDGNVGMKKFSNDQRICVFETSVETLVERNYAYLPGYYQDLCPTSKSTDEKWTRFTHEEWSTHMICLITNHPQFLIRDGIPDTLQWGVTSVVETLPAYNYGKGHFESEDTIYNFTFQQHWDFLNRFTVDDGTKLP